MDNLILKDVSDQYSRENFSRLQRFISEQVFFQGNFKLFEINLTMANLSNEVPHGLTFIPKDIIVLASSGNQNFSFQYQNFTRDSIFIANEGPVTIRFLAGRLDDISGRSASAPFQIVNPHNVFSPPFPPYTRFCCGELIDLDSDCYNQVDCDELPMDSIRQMLDLGVL